MSVLSDELRVLAINFIRVCEQPLKIPHISAVILYANDTNGDVVKEILARSSERAQDALEDGDWRQFKLVLRLFACLQGIFEGDGIFPVLDELFDRAADQQTASPEDVSKLKIRWLRPLTLA